MDLSESGADRRAARDDESIPTRPPDPSGGLFLRVGRVAPDVAGSRTMTSGRGPRLFDLARRARIYDGGPSAGRAGDPSVRRCADGIRLCPSVRSSRLSRRGDWLIMSRLLPRSLLLADTLGAGIVLGIALDRGGPFVSAQATSDGRASSPPSVAGLGRGPRRPKASDEDDLYQQLDRQYEQFQQVNRTFELVARAVSPAVVHIVAQKTSRAEDAPADPPLRGDRLGGDRPGRSRPRSSTS